MSKGNIFLGFGRGKVGDVVFYRANGEQITRARNKSPKNPQTALQLLQRVVMRTTSSAYSFMSKLCDHSFQGFQPGTANQSRFSQLNVAMLRDTLMEEINSADPNVIMSSQKYNFMAKGDFGYVFNPYIISEGSLPVMGAYFDELYTLLGPTGAAFDVSATYQQVVDFLGVEKGDQLTFVWILGEENGDDPHLPFATGLRIARVILEPGGGSPMSTNFLAANGTINQPNEANEGYIKFESHVPGGTEGTPAAMSFSLIENYSYAATSKGLYRAVGCAVILSRRVGNQWYRSTEKLSYKSIESGYNRLDGAYLGDAVMSYMSDTNSSLYLNQAKRL